MVKRRGLTQVQQAAHDAAYERCDYTVEGRFSKGGFVADYFGRTCWKIMTHGIAYHEDVSSRIYGVQPASGPAGWKQSVALRAAIEQVLNSGTQAIGSRAGTPESQVARPAGEPVASWTDRRLNSQASCPTLTVYVGGVVGVCSPNYDDSPTVAWVVDAKLASACEKLIAQCPRPVCLPAVTVRERTVNLKIDEGHPRFAAYAAARDAQFTPAREECGRKFDAQIRMPRSEWRRIEEELDRLAAVELRQA